MEAVYKRTTASKKDTRRNTDNRRADRKRLTQLIASFILFILVFVGRGVFPIQAENWSELLRTDTDFLTVFQDFWQELSIGNRTLTPELSKLATVFFGKEDSELSQTKQEQTEMIETPSITLLSETEMNGFLYLRENGFAVYREMQDHSERSNDEPEQFPEIVTAVAQAFNDAGEKLPSNVSYEYYELGLEQTAVPVMGTVTSGFEYRTSPLSGKREFHLAIDIAAAEGTKIGAFADGVVRYIGESDDFGLYLMIDHANGVATFYAHCSKLLVRKGDAVSCGETIALVGHTGNATGSHLHFTIEKDNIRLDPAHYVEPK